MFTMGVLLGATGGALSGSAKISVAHASDTTCSAVATPSTDVSYKSLPYSFNTVSHIEADFDYARNADGEGCGAGLNLPSNFLQLSRSDQTLTLINAERHERTYDGQRLRKITLDGGLLSELAANHSVEMSKYDYCNDPSPLNLAHIGSTSGWVAQLEVNKALLGRIRYLAINVACGTTSAADDIFEMMYDDKAEGWSHRENILGLFGAGATEWNWVGIGVLRLSSDPTHLYWYHTVVFVQVLPGVKYRPPKLVDSAPPKIGTISYSASRGVATVNGVTDRPPSQQEAGVTSVGFYDAGRVHRQTARTSYDEVRAVHIPRSRSWKATISGAKAKNIHAIVFDGSGNFTDCSRAGCSAG
jgi:hypothetical protein